MRLESKKLLEDIRAAAASILKFTAGKSFDQYCQDELVQAADERKFAVIGEALNRLAKSDPDLASQIGDFRRIINFRNLLIHGYDVVDNAVVWDVIHDDLPKLHATVMKLMGLSDD